MQKVFRITVDISKKIPAPAFEVNTNDLKSVKLEITITNGLSLLDLTDVTPRINIRKPDNEVIFQDCEIVDAKAGKVQIVLENQAYLVPGTHTAEIACYKGNEITAITGTFSYKSVKGIMNDEAVESKSEFTAIDRKIEEARKLLEDIGENGVGVDEQARQEIQEVTAQLADIATTSWTNVFASLDMRENVPIAIAHASDSTGDAANEYFELAWKKCFADVWKERPVRVQRWYDPGSGGSYQGWETWQTGNVEPSTQTVVVYADDFNTDSPTVIGTLTPQVGTIYSELAAHSSYWSVTGGKLTRGGTDDGNRATLRATWNSRTSKDFTFTGKVNVPSAGANRSTEIFVVSDAETIARVGIAITGTGEATLGKYFNSTTTALGTFPTGTYNGNELNFELSLTGTRLTAKLGNNTLTADLSQEEVDTLATKTKTAIRSHIPSTKFDGFSVSYIAQSSETSPSTPQVSVYNGGAAGKTIEYHRTNLRTMYPTRPDLIFINQGHNYSSANGWDSNRMIQSIQSFVDELNALYPSDKPIPVVVTSQNPQFGTGKENEHLLKMKDLKAYADKKGWGYIPTFEAFAMRNDGGANQMLDNIHPGVGTGRVIQAEVAEKWIKSQTKRPTS